MADYCTTAQVKAYISTAKSTDDALIANFITRASKRIDTYCGRTFVQRTETRLFDAVEDVDGQTLYMDDDLLGVVSITNGDSTSIATSSVVLLPANDTPKYAIRLKSSSALSWTYTTDPEQSISINGTWGYQLGTVAPADIQHAAIRLSAWYYQQREAPFEQVALPELGAVTIPQAIPSDVVAILQPYKRFIVGVV